MRVIGEMSGEGIRGRLGGAARTTKSARDTPRQLSRFLAASGNNAKCNAHTAIFWCVQVEPTERINERQKGLVHLFSLFRFHLVAR